MTRNDTILNTDTKEKIRKAGHAGFSRQNTHIAIGVGQGATNGSSLTASRKVKLPLT
ncbi:MAG: hypothetical protein AB7S77_02795 [Desulfatirhabdiaceae bacterium]